VETLGWINEYAFDLLSMSINKYYRQVFGKHAAKAIMATSDDADSDLAKMRAKRAARKQGASSTAATSNAVASAPPRLPPPKLTRKEAAPSTAATTSIPPLSQRPVTPPSRLPSPAPSSPLSLLSSPKLPSPLKRDTSMAKIAEPATADNAPTTPTDPQPPLTTRRKVVPKPKPAKPKSSVRPTRLVASRAQVDVEESAPVIPQKKQAAPRRGRKAA
jgi:hypothetical protein